MSPTTEGSGDGEQPKEGEHREDTFFLPPDYPGIENLKPGDKVTLLVVGKDEDGHVEVECDPKEMAEKAKQGNYKPMMDDFDESMK